MAATGSRRAERRRRRFIPCAAPQRGSATITEPASQSTSHSRGIRSCMDDVRSRTRSVERARLLAGAEMASICEGRGVRWRVEAQAVVCHRQCGAGLSASPA